ncbi:MAG: hypothetical protein R2788_16935 [Saprospiraceae bacterium]
MRIALLKEAVEKSKFDYIRVFLLQGLRIEHRLIVVVEISNRVEEN